MSGAKPVSSIYFLRKVQTSSENFLYARAVQILSLEFSGQEVMPEGWQK
jgi:hypothetical protein